MWDILKPVIKSWIGTVLPSYSGWRTPAVSYRVVDAISLIPGSGASSLNQCQSHSSTLTMTCRSEITWRRCSSLKPTWTLSRTSSRLNTASPWNLMPAFINSMQNLETHCLWAVLRRRNKPNKSISRLCKREEKSHMGKSTIPRRTSLTSKSVTSQQEVSWKSSLSMCRSSRSAYAPSGSLQLTQPSHLVILTTFLLRRWASSMRHQTCFHRLVLRPPDRCILGPSKLLYAPANQFPTTTQLHTSWPISLWRSIKSKHCSSWTKLKSLIKTSSSSMQRKN